VLIAPYSNLFQSKGASPAIWDQTVLPATRHTWTHSAITLARQASTWLTCRRRMEGWVGLSVGYIPRWFTCWHHVDRKFNI